jgi:glycosyltransferase involved in cell wall biosynthesis
MFGKYSFLQINYKQNMNTLAISVIVPVYNVEQYLRECLDSILNQTFTYFELLLINDGSPDASGRICNEYAQKDSRIRVFHKENGGVSSARNLGLDNARGKWITFIDSDDWVDNTYLEHLLEGDEDVELRVMGIMIQEHKQKWKKQATREELFLNDDLWKFYKLYMSYSVFLGPCMKLFLLSVINKFNIRFDHGLSYGEDTIFNLQYFKQIKSISSKKYVEYYYRNTESSLCKNVSIDGYENLIKACEQLIFLSQNDKIFTDAANKYLSILHYCLCVYNIKHLYLHQNLETQNRRECLSQIFTKLKNSGFNWLRCFSIVRGQLATCILCLYNMPVFIADRIFVFLFWLK